MTPIAAAPQDPVALVVAAMAAQEAGRIPEALAGFAAAVRLAPAMLDLRLMLAYAEGAAGERQRARRTLDETPGIASMSGADARRVADAACEAGADTAALMALDRALRFTPHDPDLHAARGAVLHRTGAVDEARELLARGAARWPRHVPTRMNRARLLAETGEPEPALHEYDRVLGLDPHHARARSNRGLVRLLLGDHAGGWQDYEARRSLPFHTSAMPHGVPAWDGRDAAGRTLLLWGEQGLGDQIMLARFAPRLAGLGARVVLRVHPALRTLFHDMAGVSDVVSDADGDAAWNTLGVDAHVPTFSVPHLLGLTTDTQFGAAPYLTRPMTQRSAPGPGRTPGDRPRVALVWAGSASHGNDRNRSLPDTWLGHLLAAEVTWVSLQLGARAGELPALAEGARARVETGITDGCDFRHSAAVLAGCDALVTVDTSVAHLGGALGVPTLAMIPFIPDWRWRTEGTASYWYDSMELVRQPATGDWAGTIAGVHEALARRFGRQVLPGSGTEFPPRA